jgi:hypothetical protein
VATAVSPKRGTNLGLPSDEHDADTKDAVIGPEWSTPGGVDALYTPALRQLYAEKMREVVAA